MATVNHTYAKNVPVQNASGNPTRTLWALSRALKKAGYKYLGSMRNAASVEKTGDPALDLWNNTSGTVGSLTTSGSGAIVAAPSRGRALVTGLTGVTSAMKGQFLKITGSSVSANNNVHQIEEIVDATSVKIDARTFAVGADAVGRSWEIRDPQGDAWPSLTSGWWSARGPSLLKIPFTALGSGTWQRGENITQATTGAEGELVSIHEENGGGWLVVAPRVRGTGAGAYGWETQVITGGSSAATITPSANPTEYRIEITLATTFGTGVAPTSMISVGQFDTTELASVDGSFSYQIVNDASVTSALAGCPGGNAGFPAHAQMIHGQTMLAGLSLSRSDTSTGFGFCCVADCIEEQGWSADGSWAMWSAASNGNLGHGSHLIAFQLCDDAEPGDLFPYVSWRHFTADTATTHNRSGATSGAQAAGLSNAQWLTNWSTTPPGGTWRRRGLTSEQFCNAFPMALFQKASAAAGALYTAINWTPPLTRSIPDLDMTVAVTMPIPMACFDVGRKVYKGTPRWLRMVQGGAAGSVLVESASRKFIQLHSEQTTGEGALVAGPWTGGNDVTWF